MREQVIKTIEENKIIAIVRGISEEQAVSAACTNNGILNVHEGALAENSIMRGVIHGGIFIVGKNTVGRNGDFTSLVGNSHTRINVVGCRTV